MKKVFFSLFALVFSVSLFAESRVTIKLTSTKTEKSMQHWLYELFAKESTNGIEEIDGGYALELGEGAIRTRKGRGFTTEIELDRSYVKGKRAYLAKGDRDSLQQALWVYLSDEFMDGDYAPVDKTGPWYSLYDGKTYIGCTRDKNADTYDCDFRFDGSSREIIP